MTQQHEPTDGLEYPCQKCGKAEASLATLDVCDRCYISIVAKDTQSQGMQLQLPLKDGSPSFEEVVNAVSYTRARAFKQGGFSVGKKYPTLNEEVNNRIDKMSAVRRQRELDGMDPHELDRFV